MTCCTMLYLLGTGSFELRGDGSIHEWTIENQTPAGSAKLNFAALELAVFSVRVKTGTSSSAALLRTHPPMGYPGNLRSFSARSQKQFLRLRILFLTMFSFLKIHIIILVISVVRNNPKAAPPVSNRQLLMRVAFEAKISQSAGSCRCSSCGF